MGGRRQQFPFCNKIDEPNIFRVFPYFLFCFKKENKRLQDRPGSQLQAEKEPEIERFIHVVAGFFLSWKNISASREQKKRNIFSKKTCKKYDGRTIKLFIGEEEFLKYTRSYVRSRKPEEFFFPNYDD